MSLPADCQKVADELARLSESFGELVLPLTERQFDWQPVPGRAWSIGQCVDHLQRTNRVYLTALAAAATKGRLEGRFRREPLRANWLGRRFLPLLEPPPRFRVPVPLGDLIPKSACPKQETWQAFLAAKEETIGLLRSTADLDLCALRFRNPVMKNLPVFNLAAGFLILAAHERRHLAQAQAVRAHPGFPAR